VDPNQSEWTQALTWYTQALTVSRNVEDRRGEAEALLRLGTVYELTGDRANATRYWKAALRILDDLGMNVEGEQAA